MFILLQDSRDFLRFTHQPNQHPQLCCHCRQPIAVTGTGRWNCPHAFEFLWESDSIRREVLPRNGDNLVEQICLVMSFYNEPAGSLNTWETAAYHCNQRSPPRFKTQCCQHIAQPGSWDIRVVEFLLQQSRVGCAAKTCISSIPSPTSKPFVRIVQECLKMEAVWDAWALNEEGKKDVNYSITATEIQCENMFIPLLIHSKSPN